jgi:hypothetical protein
MSAVLYKRFFAECCHRRKLDITWKAAAQVQFWTVVQHLPGGTEQSRENRSRVRWMLTLNTPHPHPKKKIKHVKLRNLDPGGGGERCHLSLSCHLKNSIQPPSAGRGKSLARGGHSAVAARRVTQEEVSGSACRVS